jgi:endogenous inhibitor of DNA gyrase (YacG/DUF329 family)
MSRVFDAFVRLTSPRLCVSLLDSGRPYKLRPATIEALDLLKVVVMTKETKVDENECSICQEDLVVGQEIVFLPICNHSFHNECVQRWFRLVKIHSSLAPLTFPHSSFGRSKVGVQFVEQRFLVLALGQRTKRGSCLTAGKQTWSASLKKWIMKRRTSTRGKSRWHTTHPVPGEEIRQQTVMKSVKMKRMTAMRRAVVALLDDTETMKTLVRMKMRTRKMATLVVNSMAILRLNLLSPSKWLILCWERCQRVDLPLIDSPAPSHIVTDSQACSPL